MNCFIFFYPDNCARRAGLDTGRLVFILALIAAYRYLLIFIRPDSAIRADHHAHPASYAAGFIMHDHPFFFIVNEGGSHAGINALRVIAVAA
jgi:hypothetical protein